MGNALQSEVPHLIKNTLSAFSDFTEAPPECVHFLVYYIMRLYSCSVYIEIIIISFTLSKQSECSIENF